MIHYTLRCTAAHEFDGWFRDSASFDSQAAAGLLDCPVCACTRITRALMAPSIGGRTPQPEPAPPAAQPANAKPPPPSVPMPANMRAALQRIRAEVEQRCDYVGPRFAAEVRRRADSDAPPARPIYGEATPEEAEALAEDGIEVSRIPWVPLAES